MKKFILFSFCALLSAIGFGAFAQGSATLDREGYPVVYLRGGFNGTGWQPDSRYKFTRTGDVYSLTINKSNAIGNCDFKIGDDAWELIDLGAGESVNASTYLNCFFASANISTDGLSDAVISFTYAPGEFYTTKTVKFVVDGIEPEPTLDPLPGDYPEVYLRGNFTDIPWECDKRYKFTRSGDKYTLTITPSNPIKAGNEFKISNSDWSYNYGGVDENISIDSSKTMDMLFNGYNLTTGIDITDATISFDYRGESESFIDVKFVINGIDPEPDPDPVPGDYPDIYLRGDFNGTGWRPNGNYKFSRSGDKYTLTITPSNPIEAGSHFKIGDNTDDWEIFNLGGMSLDIAVDASQGLTLIKKGANLTTNVNITSGSISFTYPGADYYTVPVNFVIDGTEPVKPGPVTGLSGTLPVLYINVYTDETHSFFDNSVNDKDLAHKNYFTYAEYWLDVNNCQWLIDEGAKNVGSEEEPLALQIKARGNFTRTGFSKKPFKLKLDKKQSLLGMSKSKHYAILAHADDTKGYLRNFTGFNLGKRIGLPWTPWQQPVEVVINGDYRGLYFLTESIRIEEDRVNITELDDNVSEKGLVSGGYIVELDNYDEDDDAQIRMPEAVHRNAGIYHNDMLRITFDTPEVYSELQRRFITDQFTAMNGYVGNGDDALWSYLDLDDAARYYIVEEIVSHTESYHGSTYLFRDRGEGQKWHFSPLWDFGNAFNGSTSAFFYDQNANFTFGNTWIPSMRCNAKFNDKVKKTWLWFMSNEFDGLYDDIATYVDHLREAAKADRERWKNAPVPSYGGTTQGVADNTDMTSRQNEVVGHLNSKINWLKGKFGDYTRGTYAEPERDTTPAAKLPDYAIAGIEFEATVDLDDAEGIEFFNLQGIRIDNPEAGGLYIIRRGDRTSKVIVR